MLKYGKAAGMAARELHGRVAQDQRGPAFERPGPGRHVHLEVLHP